MILKKFQTKEKVKLQHDYKGKFQIEIITKNLSKQEELHWNVAS